MKAVEKMVEKAVGRLVSVQVGMPKRYCMPDGMRVDFRHPNWKSGIFKEAVGGAVWVGKTSMAGDGQADLENHGGPDNVVLAYDAGHYPVWRQELELPELAYGAFGENLTVEGFSDETVCVGDTWRVGGEKGLVLQVSQSRQPCYKLARRLERNHIVKMVKERGWGGWYMRVLREGFVESGMEIERVERLHPEWPVTRAVQVMYDRNKARDEAQTLGNLEVLSARWKKELLE